MAFLTNNSSFDGNSLLSGPDYDKTTTPTNATKIKLAELDGSDFYKIYYKFNNQSTWTEFYTKTNDQSGNRSESFLVPYCHSDSIQIRFGFSSYRN